MPFTHLIVEGNNINEQAIDVLLHLVKRKIPDNMQELHFIHAKCVWRATNELLKQMKGRNYLRKLSLVEAGLNEFSLKPLTEMVAKQKTLIYLDISWNGLMAEQMKPLLVVLSKNRRL